jgi:hypothetical protein
MKVRELQVERKEIARADDPLAVLAQRLRDYEVTEMNALDELGPQRELLEEGRGR